MKIIIDTLTDKNFYIPMLLAASIIVSMSILTILWGKYLIDKLHNK